MQLTISQLEDHEEKAEERNRAIREKQRVRSLLKGVIH